MTTTEREAVAPDLVLAHDLDADEAPGPTFCERGWCAPGGTQCPTCRLADASCDACGEPAAAFVDGLPLCHACNAEAA